jgi:uncharacterized membrane protein
MYEKILGFIVTFILVIIIDYIWLGIIAKGFIQNQIGDLLLDKVKIFPALIVYFLITLGIFIFVLNSDLIQGSNYKVVIYGIIFGLIAYAIYDFTNFATLKGWTIKMLVVDVLWGGFIGGLTAFIGNYFMNLFK